MVVLIMCCCGSTAQDYWSHRYDFDKGNDIATDLHIVDTFGIIVQVIALCNLNSTFCSGLLTVGNDGDVLWRNIYYDSIRVNHPEAVFLTTDTIYINLNYSNPDSLHLVVHKVDFNGNINGAFRYTGNTESPINLARELSGSDSTFFTSYAYQDSEGLLKEQITAYSSEWHFENSWSLPNRSGYPVVVLSGLRTTSDGGFVVAYSARAGENEEYTVTVEKYDSSADFQWRSELPHFGDHRSRHCKIEQCKDGGYIGMWQFDTLNLNITNLPTLLFKLDTLGTVEWERLDLDDQINLNDIFVTRNGDIVGCGVAEDSNWDPNDGEYVVGYLIRLSEDGKVIWERRIADTLDGGYRGEFHCGAEFTSGDLAFGGVVSDLIFGSEDDPTPDNIWIVRTDSMGCLSPECGDWQNVVSTEELVHNTDQKNFIVFPNPTQSVIYVGRELNSNIKNGKYSLSIFDYSGRIMHTSSFDPDRVEEIDLEGFASGNYILTIWRDHYLIQREKIFVE